MLRTKIAILISAIIMSLLLTASSVAASVPKDFGKADWAVDNWHEAVRYLQHLTDKTIQLRMLSVPDKGDLRQQAWHEFWIKYDPVMDTKVNEFRQKYFDRIAYANEHFTTDTQPEGWLTDRGEAYVKMGAPENVEKLIVKSRDDSPLYVWNYEDTYGTTLFFLDYGDRDVYLLNPEQMEEHRPVKWEAKKDF